MNLGPNDIIDLYTGGTNLIRMNASGNLLIQKTSTSDYGKLEVKGGTADNIETADITAKTVATFSGSTPGTTAAGKGAGIVIKPIADRGCNYFIGVANDGTNQEAHGRFIIRSGNFAGQTTERLRINANGELQISGNCEPAADTTYDLGANTSNRWRNIYGQTLSLTSYAVMGSLVVNDPGSSYYSFNNRIGGNTIIKGTTVCTDDIHSTVPSTFPASNVQLMVYTSTTGQPISNTNCARLLIATDAKQVGPQGYNGAIDFGNSDCSASTGANEFDWRLASIMSNAAGDTSSTIGDGDLQFWTKTSSGSLTKRFNIASDGTLTGTDTSIGNLSDQRLKTNIQDYGYDLDKFKQLKTRTFDWINPEFHQEGNQRGFVAQEVETVDPYFNYEFKISKESAEKDYDLLSDGDENYRPGKASKLNGKDAMYVSVIQQLMSKIETLETKVTALGG